MNRRLCNSVKHSLKFLSWTGKKFSECTEFLSVDPKNRTTFMHLNACTKEQQQSLLEPITGQFNNIQMLGKLKTQDKAKGWILIRWYDMNASIEILISASSISLCVRNTLTETIKLWQSVSNERSAHYRVFLTTIAN